MCGNKIFYILSVAWPTQFKVMWGNKKYNGRVFTWPKYLQWQQVQDNQTNLRSWDVNYFAVLHNWSCAALNKRFVHWKQCCWIFPSDGWQILLWLFLNKLCCLILETIIIFKINYFQLTICWIRQNLIIVHSFHQMKCIGIKFSWDINRTLVQ